MLTINNTIDGYLKDIEIKGNTIQDINQTGDLADIRSVGDKLENQELYEIPVLITGKNLFNKNDALKLGYYYSATGAIEGSGLLSDSNKNFISEKYFKITSDTITWSGIGGTVIHPLALCFYDKDKNFINRYETSNIINYTVPSNAEYFRIKGDYNRIDYLQLEFGAKTEYQEYKEHKLTILSPVQLEKVGDVRDRIIEKDGVWGVEKGVGNTILDGSESKISLGGQSNDNYLEVLITLSNVKRGNALCDKFIFNTIYGDYELVRATENLIILFVKTSRLSSPNIEGVRQWLQANNTKVMYQFVTPQFIPLPHDQQVKLRTFANKTNIHFECEIEPTLKASVPKSLGASVSSNTEQIDILHRELDKIKKLLLQSEVVF